MSKATACIMASFLVLQSIGAFFVEGTSKGVDGLTLIGRESSAQDDILIQIRRGFSVARAQGSCCGKCGGKGYCSPQSGNCYASESKSYYETCGAQASCCGKCGGKGYCSPQSGNCYASESKNYYETCAEPAEPTDCCDKCSGKAYCSPGSGNCYWNKAKDYYKVCDASAVPPGALPKANSSENAIKFMSYNLMGWNAFNQNKWRGDNVLAKIKDWKPAVLGAQEVEKGGYGYEEVSDIVTGATALEHVGGSQFYNADELEKHESSWVNLVKGYWMSMTRFTHKKSGVDFLFFDSHWKHGYGMEQAEIIANAISEKRKKYGNPPTVLVGDTNQFCKAYDTSAIKYLKGETGSSPVTFQDVHSDDYGKSFSDNNNPDCRVDFILASTGQWALVRSFIDREGMGLNGKASDHAPLMAELVPIA